MLYNKTIELSDYDKDVTFEHVDYVQKQLEGAFTPWGTPFRRWEYGLGLAALLESGALTILEVGGGSSLFAAAAITSGFRVTVVDPDDYRAMFAEQSARIETNIPFVHQSFFDYPEGEQFDAVVSISTIEHVPDDEAFFLKLLNYVKPGGLLFLTTDFHDSGKALFGGHVTTYNKEKMMRLIGLGQERGFEVFGGDPDYQPSQTLVHGMYTFASLAMKRSTE